MRHAVLIAGGGPTGLMLGAELALAGIDVAIVERRPTQELAGLRAGGLHARAIEVLDQRGVAERFVSQGRTFPVVSFHVPLNISDLPTRHNYVLALSQNRIERILAEWVDELPVTIYRGREVSAFTQDDDGIDVTLADGQRIHAEYLVGCDGGRSLIRKTAGIEFPGWEPTTSWLIAEAQTAEEPKLGFHHDEFGVQHAIGKSEDGKLARIVLAEREVVRDREATLEDVRRMLRAVYGTDYGIHSPTWISRFTDMTRQAAAYRNGRVLLAGDAAHVHPPLGGQGLNVGLQDAVNLGWKLAQVIKGISPSSLLDTYHAERHPVGARVLRYTMAQVAMRRPDERTRALNEYFAELLALDEPRKRLGAEITGLGVRYDLAQSEPEEKHPLLGRRMPDLDLLTAQGPLRLFTLLHDARAVLLNLGEPDGVDIAGGSGRVKVVDATYDGTWELPGVGSVCPPRAVLIRPDGYVAWISDGSQRGLDEALTTWFGAPA